MYHSSGQYDDCVFKPFGTRLPSCDFTSGNVLRNESRMGGGGEVAAPVVLVPV